MSMMLYDFDILPRCEGGPTFLRPPGEADRQLFIVGATRRFRLFGVIPIAALDSVVLSQDSLRAGKPEHRTFRVRRYQYEKWL